MKYCVNCGSAIDDRAAFCPECGAQQVPPPGNNGAPDGQPYGGQQYGQNMYGGPDYGNGTYQDPAMNPPARGFGSVQERSIVLCIILSIVTCGLYGLYWIVCLNDDINYLSDEQNPPSGVLVLVLMIVTCGIYGLYWHYKMGNAVDRIRGGSGNTGILYLLLAIFQLAIVNLVLMQDTVNNTLRRYQ